ncbi:O-antigen ligase family protein, partial [Clostridium sp.]|uniref:O-antigen ligase family protein n=1 Tax=Clostridium sp. TaxID=1506 RepID=UPI00261156E0
MDIIKRVCKIKIIDDSVYFKSTFILWGLIHSLALGQYITSYASPVILLWGGLLVIKSLFIDKINFSKKYWILISGFLVSYLITIIINRDLNFIGNTKTLIWAIIMIVILFINDYNKNKEEILKDVSRIAKVIVLATLIISGISILQFLVNISFFVTRVDGRSIPQGYYAARLWGLYVDPNQECNVALISLALSTILLIRKRVLNKVLLVLNIVVQYLLIVLSGSRGGSIGLGVLSIGILYLVVDRIFKDKINKIGVRTIISLVLSVMLAFTLIATQGVTKRVLVLIPEMNTNIRDNASSGNKEHNDKITIDRPDVETSNGRIQLWTDGLKLSRNFPAFGVGDRNIMIVAEKLMPGSSITKQYVHNGYIHMLLSGGIVGLS